MAVEYSVEVCNKLKAKVENTSLHRPMRIGRYDAGDQLEYNVTAVEGGQSSLVRLRIERFVGGGFAGQVYRVRVESIETQGQSLGSLAVGCQYAMKILIPPSGLSCLFRNVLYWIGFQGPFQLQVNPTASRAGALWQKLIRRAAKIRFGDEYAVNDIHATFVDETLGSCGELSDWVDGRTWQLEVDDHLDVLKLWRKGKDVDISKLGSPEYRAKKKFMDDFVKLLHDMGAHEFARQYEWSTAKSQPNCLKRTDSGDDPAKGLTAVDFRAGLTLLPFLPMSPGDFKLIWQGIKRGSIVQFDRGNLKQLEAFIDSHNDRFADMKPLLEELKSAEDIYRNSLPDITHNGLKLFYSGKLWKTMFSSAYTGWKVKGLVSKDYDGKLSYCAICRIAFFLLGVIPFFGRFLRKCWGRADWREHYASLLSNFGYIKRTLRAKMAENVIKWHRAGRISAEKALPLAGNPLLYCLHLPLSILPVGLHRFLTDSQVRKEKLVFIFVRPFRLYFSASLRKQWLESMVSDGRKKHILSDDDADTVLSQLDEPYIQKYLVSLVVHVMTLPVTQIVSVIVAAIYYWKHPEMPEEEKALRVGGILVLFQIIPVSPGSFCRGLYTTILAIKERNFKDYNIALFLSYFKYVGYLAFPIQMSYHYPAMARFMAGHWATDAVHIVPVFGEQGALFERWVFCLFYNWPLTIRRRMKKIAEFRAKLKPRYWHIPLCAIAAAGILAVGESIYFNEAGVLPTMKNILYLIALLPMVTGAVVTRACGGAALWKRIVMATITGFAVGVLYTLATAAIHPDLVESTGQIVKTGIWRVFAMTLFATIGVILRELTLPDPDLTK